MTYRPSARDAKTSSGTSYRDLTAESDALVFDTGPLRHFAHQGWLGVLHFVAGERAVVIPESVERELNHQIEDMATLRQVLEAPWIVVDRSDDIAFVAAFARYEERLAVGLNNRGECGVLALGAIRGYEVVLDDNVARNIATGEGLRVTSTLALLCNAIREGQLTVPLVEALADDLIIGDYYLPFGRGGFRRWACEEGLIDYF